MYTNKDREKQKHKLWLEGMKLLNIILVTLPFALIWKSFYVKKLAVSYGYKGVWIIIAIFTLLYIMLGKTYAALKISGPRISEIVYSQALAEVFSDIVIYLIIFLLMKKIPPVWPMLVTLAGQLLISAFWAAWAHHTYYRKVKPAPTVVVWDMRESLDELVNAYGMSKRFEVIRNLSVGECVRDIPSSLEGADAVFLCGIHSHERNQIVKYCVRYGIRAYVIPRVGDVIMSGAESMHMFHLPMLMLEKYNPSPLYLIIKRIFDILVSAIALLILSPVMIVVGMLIRRDGGTAFYRQARLTKDGRVFEVLKFRSMRMDAEKDGVARLSSGENDDRITPIGRFIRSCRIDELPQLFNILRGDMTLVGPRPERPEIAAQYEEEIPEFHLRLQAKAGLTGLAQVYGKYNTTPYDKLLMDLQYIARPGIANDLEILFATVKILFMPESTEGIEAGGTTAMVGSHAAKDEGHYESAVGK